jgi:hypothetical protein
MGYGSSLPKSDALFLSPLLGLRRPDLMAAPLPWMINPAATRKRVAAWRERDWIAWLNERLTLPFLAAIGGPANFKPRLGEVRRLRPSTREEARHYGVYFDVALDRETAVIGATAVAPLDVASNNALAPMEYHAYRKRVGSPPGAKGLEQRGGFGRPTAQ